MIPEQRLANGKQPDGTLRDGFNLPRGYWEAKDTADDLPTEIKKKIAAGYPTINTIFEDTQWAVLYQSGRQALEVDLRQPRNVADLLTQFFTYTEPEIATFEHAVQEFKERIPELAGGLKGLIQSQYTDNEAFKRAFTNFWMLCQTSLDTETDARAVEEMLIQHLLTERLFRTVFNNPDFTRRNVIAAEIENVIDALTSNAFNRADFLRSLDRYYVAIERAAKGLEDWSEKQTFLNAVYGRFFQGYSTKQADTHGIVYTPQEIVDFMCASVEEVLRAEFGTALSEPGVQVLDPCTGTGSFIVNLLRRITAKDLDYKYANDLFANEIMLLPYYIAALNIEHAYYERTGQYKPFDGLCFVDTLELAERVAHQGLGERSLWGMDHNTERVEREKAAPIMVVIGNPPYNVGQENENDNNRNRRYPIIDERVRVTYARDSQATNKNKLADPYVKFFRWAVDRLQGRDGIVCLVTNNSFVDQITFDGMRKHLQQDFAQIYHLDLHGNVRVNPHISGTSHNVFRIQVGVGITIAVRATSNPTQALYYCRVPDMWRREQKLAYLGEVGSIAGVEWDELQPDAQHTWLTEGLRPEFGTFLALGTKEAKAARGLEARRVEVGTIFKNYSPGIQTNRDSWMYDFNADRLSLKAAAMTETYNSELSRWVRAACPADIDAFVLADETKIKWSSRLKECFARKMEATYRASAIRNSLYRPFTRQYVYFDPLMTHRQALFPFVFPTLATERENSVICVAGVGDRKGFGALVTNVIANLDLAFEKAQCFPFYTYAEDGSNRSENITDWALAEFQTTYGLGITKRDIFAYVYGILYHPWYRERYAVNLKRELPRIPLLSDQRDFETCVRTGEALMKLHLGYEEAEKYPLQRIENPAVPINWRVQKMKLTPDRSAVIFNEWLTLAGLPPECFEYRLGNRSALEWVIDQYQVSTDSRSGITSDPNRPKDPQYIAQLVGRVVTVSVETVRLVRELATAISLDSVTGATLVESQVGAPGN